MAAVVAHQVHKGVIGAWRHSSLASVYSLAFSLKDLDLLECNSSNTAVLEAVPDATSENTASAPLESPSLSPRGRQTEAQLRILKKGEHGLRDKLISAASWRVLNRLQKSGYKSYLVGGSVRDLLVKQTPKDFDVLTTAEPKEVKRTFAGRCMIVGRRFPICHVHSLNTVIEVSSFSTTLGKQKVETLVKKLVRGTEGWDHNDVARLANCLKRDFTVNGLMYDPFRCVVYDYVGGLNDLRRSQIRTVIPPDESFQEDSARILRAIRIAARLEFSFVKSTASAIRQHKASLLALNKTRLQLEVNMLMAYGASERSVRLLWRYGILEYLLPLQAQYFLSLNFNSGAKGTNLLLELLANLDIVTGPDRPCHGGLWVALLAFHLALVERPMRPVVVSAVALAVYHGSNLHRALANARKLCAMSDPEATSISGELEAGDDGVEEATTLEDCQSLLDASINNLSRFSSVAVTGKAMHVLTGESAASDRVVVTKPYFFKANQLFNRALVKDSDEHMTGVEVENYMLRHWKPDGPVRVAALTSGDLGELGFVFSHVVLSTLFPKRRNPVSSVLQEHANVI